MPSSTLLRRLTIPLAAATSIALLPGVAAGQEERTTLLCPDDVPTAGFDDRDEAASVHRSTIDCLAFLGVTEGYGYDEGQRYLPHADVRRDQMASFIVRALDASGASLPAPSDQGFEDVADNAHVERIRQLAEMGITEGKSATRYAPGESVSRDQMASFLLRASAWFRGTSEDALGGGPTRFADIAGNHHADNIAGSYHLGITNGLEMDRYAPQEAVNRQQMATFIARTLDAMNQDPAVCSNPRDGYTLTMPDGWVTNPGDVEPRCTVFDDERFLLEPATELPGDTKARVLVEPIGYQEAADEAEFREELSRRDDTAGDGHAAIVVESRATGEGLRPEGTEMYTWYVDATVDGQERTLIATTDTRADDHAANRDGVDELMDGLVLGVPTRAEVASYEGGGRPFTVDAWVSGQSGLCTQAIVGQNVSTVCAALGGLDEVEVRAHEVDDDWSILAGSVDGTIDEVEVESTTGEIEEPGLVQVWGRQAFATTIAYGDVDEVRAIRDDQVVATADLPG